MENLENIEQETGQNKPKKSGAKAGLIVIIILLLGAIGIVGWMYYDTDTKLDASMKKGEDLKASRDSMISKLDSLEVVLEKIVFERDSVSDELLAKLKQVKDLKSSLWSAKNANKKELEEYKRLVAGLRESLRLKYMEIDTLRNINDSLRFTTEQLSSNLETLRISEQEKAQLLDELNAKMEKASILKAVNLVALPLNSKSKPNYKAKKIEKIKTVFFLAENHVIDPGTKSVFMRITRGDGVVLAESTDNTFEYDGEEILYSAARDIEYDNQDTKVELYYKAHDDIISGSYNITLFVEGKEIGKTSFELK